MKTCFGRPIVGAEMSPGVATRHAESVRHVGVASVSSGGQQQRRRQSRCRPPSGEFFHHKHGTILSLPKVGPKRPDRFLPNQANSRTPAPMPHGINDLAESPRPEHPGAKESLRKHNPSRQAETGPPRPSPPPAPLSTTQANQATKEHPPLTRKIDGTNPIAKAMPNLSHAIPKEGDRGQSVPMKARHS